MAALSLRCPHCGKLNDLASGIGDAAGARPHAGAISLCIGCGNWAVFEDDFVGLRQRQPTEDELKSIQADPTAQKASWAWHEAIGSRRK